MTTHTIIANGLASSPSKRSGPTCRGTSASQAPQTGEPICYRLFDGTTNEIAFERSGSFPSRIERLVAPAIEQLGEGVHLYRLPIGHQLAATPTMVGTNT